MCARNVTEPKIQGVEFQSKSANIICKFFHVNNISHIDLEKIFKVKFSGENGQFNLMKNHGCFYTFTSLEESTHPVEGHKGQIKMTKF